MLDITKIKLIIWDLDDTLWSGTLSEGSVHMDHTNIQLLQDSTDCGVINTICSKNNDEDVLAELKKYGIDNLFVFRSVNWEPKGQRIKKLLEDMSLRAPNALFIDDNISNLKEASFYNKDLMTAEPYIVKDLIEYFTNADKKDKEHKRLQQYKVLEEKRNEAKSFSNNIDFLYDCNIHVQIEKDCLSILPRLYELTQRTNQLNFTKNRPSEEEFKNQLNLCDDCGYVKVQDRFGDYGIVGFYLIKDAKLVHFLFSCRTIGQGVEQYVYAKLGFPHLDIVGDVATVLDSESTPAWIKEGEMEEQATSTPIVNDNLLFKGPCDMSGMVGYLQLDDVFQTEFTFTDNDGHLIESHNHSAHISLLKECKNERLAEIEKECFFLSDKCINSKIYDGNYRLVFLSTLIEGNYGLYRRKETGEVVTFGHYDEPLTDKTKWAGYINGSILNFGYKITQTDLERFSDRYEFIGRRTAEQYAEFIAQLLSWLPEETHLCLILGSEIKYEKEIKSTYMDRYLWHRDFNKVICSINNPRVHFINVTEHITSQNDFTNNINHFVPSVYYKMSKDIKTLIEQLCGENVKVKSNWKRYFIKQYISPFVDIILPKGLYKSIHSFVSKRV